MLHMESDVKEELTRDDIKEKSNVFYKCVECDLIVKNASSHRDKKHAKDKERVCEICGMYFKKQKRYKMHMIRHKSKEAATQFQCPMCPSTFVIKADLYVHKSVYHSERSSVICEVCGKSFTAKYMIRHKLKHTGVKALKCDICGKGFRDNFTLRGHLRQHTGEKPYKCDLCDAAYTHNVSLKTHKKSAHRIDLWQQQDPASSAVKSDSSKKQRSKPQSTSNADGVVRKLKMSAADHLVAENNALVASSSSRSLPNMVDITSDVVSNKSIVLQIPNSSSSLVNPANVSIMQPLYDNPRHSLPVHHHQSHHGSQQSRPHNLVFQACAEYGSSSIVEFQKDPQYDDPSFDSDGGRSFRKL